MILIWKRKGLLVPLAFILGQGLSISLLLTEENNNLNWVAKKAIGLIALVAMFAPAIINCLFTKYFLKDEGERYFVDDEGQLYVQSIHSTFFWIKNTQWTKIFYWFPIITMIYGAIRVVWLAFK